MGPKLYLPSAFYYRVLVLCKTAQKFHYPYKALDSIVTFASAVAAIAKLAA